FYFAKSVKPVESDEEKALNKILASGVDFKNSSFIECGNDCGQNSGGKILDYDYKDGYLRLNTESQKGGWIIFSESYDQGWQAKINNKIAPIYRANYIYQAVKAPAGDNVIEFIYKQKF
ncbi:MAG: YfhO family protein, partial [Candidatus Azambacteria bacterium]|nr:YfhO family protein [Candidatus Azambacteria bacterium]